MTNSTIELRATTVRLFARDRQLVHEQPCLAIGLMTYNGAPPDVVFWGTRVFQFSGVVGRKNIAIHYTECFGYVLLPETAPALVPVPAPATVEPGE